MIDREKVIEGLEMSYMYSNVDEGNTLVPQQLVLDVLALLKAQEPRVMTLEEVITAKPGTVVWLEDFDKPDVISGLLKIPFISTKVIDFLIVKEEVNNEVTADLEVYGSRWRCWTSRPTDEQREAEIWRDSAT